MASPVFELFHRDNRFVMGIAFLAALGGFLFGYDTGIISVANVYAAKSLGFGTFGESWTVGALLLGAITGAGLAGWTSEAFSRKWTKFASGSIYGAAALGSAFAPSLIVRCTARYVLGFAVGTASFVAPMYISEQSPRRLRGGMTTFNQIMITLGILVSYVAGFALEGFATNWRWMLGFGALPGLALAIGMVAVPHTPRWLVVSASSTGRSPASPSCCSTWSAAVPSSWPGPWARYWPSSRSASTSTSRPRSSTTARRWAWPR